MSTLSQPVDRALSALTDAHLSAFGKTYLRARARDLAPRHAYALGAVVALGLVPAPTLRGPRREWAAACEEELMVRRATSMLA